MLEFLSPKCPYCAKRIGRAKTNCPHCGSKLGIHYKKGVNYTIGYFLLSVVIGMPIGGFAGIVMSSLLLMDKWHTLSFFFGGSFATVVIFLFFLLHEEKN
ncbi:MAG: hypothetical protein AB1728_08755 [Bacteroidota bacterium]